MSILGQFISRGLEFLGAKDIKLTRGFLQIVGRSLTINSVTVTVLLKNSAGDILMCTGLTKPTDASDGYAKGCLFIKTDAATGVKGLYENKGTKDSCVFDVIGDAAVSEITLAQGSVIVGNASGVGVALDGKTSAQILIGNGTTMVSVAVSGDATISAAGAITIGNGAVTRVKMSAAAGSKSVQSVSATIATTGNTDSYVIVPEAGSLSGIDFSGIDALAAHDTNYITWSVTNLGQAGAGNTAMLAATDANTTKVTGGTALVANGKRSLTVHGTGANLVVAKGDRLLIRAAASGTLANTVTVPVYCLCFSGTT